MLADVWQYNRQQIIDEVNKHAASHIAIFRVNIVHHHAEKEGLTPKIPMEEFDMSDEKEEWGDEEDIDGLDPRPFEIGNHPFPVEQFLKDRGKQ